MINKCFVTKITTPMENNSEEYLYGVKIVFDGYGDGELKFSINRNVDVSQEIINNTDGTITYQYSGSTGHTLVFSGIRNGNVVIKDMRNLFFKIISMSNGNYPIRSIDLNSAMYANVLAENAAQYTYWIYMCGKAAEGNIIDFSKFIALTQLYLGHPSDNSRFSYIEGSLEDLAEGMISFGRTSGSLAVTCNGIVTVNGTAPANTTVKTITFSGSTYSIA